LVFHNLLHYFLILEANVVNLRYALPYLKLTQGQIAVMSSFSGEVGLIFRTAYCASKFAVTGFFEALRMEVQGKIDITIVCPPTVETNLRKNAILPESHHSREAALHVPIPVDGSPTKDNGYTL
jgi:short-subunit dehydrogenase